MKRKYVEWIHLVWTSRTREHDKGISYFCGEEEFLLSEASLWNYLLSNAADAQSFMTFTDEIVTLLDCRAIKAKGNYAEKWR